jgi:hypothetical protein
MSCVVESKNDDDYFIVHSCTGGHWVIMWTDRRGVIRNTAARAHRLTCQFASQEKA